MLIVYHTCGMSKRSKPYSCTSLPYQGLVGHVVLMSNIARCPTWGDRQPCPRSCSTGFACLQMTKVPGRSGPKRLGCGHCDMALTTSSPEHVLGPPQLFLTPGWGGVSPQTHRGRLAEALHHRFGRGKVEAEQSVGTGRLHGNGDGRQAAAQRTDAGQRRSPSEGWCGREAASAPRRAAHAQAASAGRRTHGSNPI